MENTKKILILGGQGNGGVIANAIQDAYNRGYTEWICEGFLNDGEKKGIIIDSFPVVGDIQNDIHKYLNEGCYFINTILRIDG